MFFSAHGKLPTVKDILQTLRLDVYLCKSLYLMNTMHKLLILTSALDFFNDLTRLFIKTVNVDSKQFFLSLIFVGLM